jgi:hypothetical protein
MTVLEVLDALTMSAVVVTHVMIHRALVTAAMPAVRIVEEVAPMTTVVMAV